jgi:hypothetical protein
MHADRRGVDKAAVELQPGIFRPDLSVVTTGAAGRGARRSRGSTADSDRQVIARIGPLTRIVSGAPF